MKPTINIQIQRNVLLTLTNIGYLILFDTNWSKGGIYMLVVQLFDH